MSAEVMGTMQYAAMHLQTPLFVVLGHEGCGAVEAALEARHPDADHPERIARLLECIVPALAEIDHSVTRAEQMRAAVEANVRWSMQQVHETPEAAARQTEGRLKLVGAIYELQTGRVRFLP
jgi:carbonic anhydrase